MSITEDQAIAGHGYIRLLQAIPVWCSYGHISYIDEYDGYSHVSSPGWPGCSMCVILGISLLYLLICSYLLMGAQCLLLDPLWGKLDEPNGHIHVDTACQNSDSQLCRIVPNIHECQGLSGMHGSTLLYRLLPLRDIHWSCSPYDPSDEHLLPQRPWQPAQHKIQPEWQRCPIAWQRTMYLGRVC